MSKKNYYLQYLNSNENNIKNIWKGIKQIISIRSLNGGLPPKIVSPNNTELVDSKQIASGFNEHFVNVGNNTYLLSVCNLAMSYLLPAQVQSLFVTPTTQDEIEDEIKNLKPSKATGPYSIPIEILKILGYLVSKPLEIIIGNSSLSSSIVPHQFKLAQV